MFRVVLKIGAGSFLLLGIAGFASAADSATVFSQRQSMQSTLSSYRQDVSSLFASVPQSHIVPERDVIGISVSVERPDATVVPYNKTVDKSSRSTTPRLDYAGLRATPLISFSNKRFGVGFVGEAGQLQAHYIDDTSSGYAEEFGNAKFSGIGLYGYFIPEARFLPNFVTPLFLVGGKSLNVVHESIGTVLSAYNSKTTTKYTYTVSKYEVGLDLGIELAKRCTIVPWTSYSMVGVGPEKGGTSSSGVVPTTTSVLPVQANMSLRSDQALFWTLAPKLSYGIDFSVSFGKFRIKFGGMLGVLGSLMKTNDHVYDNTLTAGLSYDFKSH